MDRNLDPALLKWSQHAGVDHLFQVFLPHTEALNHPCSGHPSHPIHLSYLTVRVSFHVQEAIFSPTRCTSGSERAEWQEGNGPRFFAPLTRSDRDCCTARDVGVGQSVVMCAHMFSVCGCVFRCVAGECSGTHQPVIAHNCIHLWERQRWTLVRSVTRTATSLLPQD